MSMFADARNDDVYNQDFVCDTDKEFLRGYDFAMEQVLNMLRDLYNYMTRNELLEALIDKEDVEKMLSEKAEEYLEGERDMLVTSMIDSLDKEEYDVLKKKALKQNEGKKEYYDTIHYAFTGEKRFREA